MEIGAIKVSWFDENDKHLLKSVMYPPQKRAEALQFAETKQDSATMEMLSQNGDSYEWRLIPDKNTWKMDLGVSLFENKLVMALLVILIIMGVVYSVKLIAR